MSSVFEVDSYHKLRAFGSGDFYSARNHANLIEHLAFSTVHFCLHVLRTKCINLRNIRVY